MTLRDVVRVPFDAVRYAYRELRKALFTAARPTGTHLVVDAGVEGVEAALGRQSYAPNWELSYYERGEMLDQARVVHDERTVGGREYRWWQTHVRGWAHAGGVALHGHWELDPTENPGAHLDGVGFDVGTGMANLRRALGDAGVTDTETTVP